MLDWIENAFQKYNAPDYAIRELYNVEKQLEKLPISKEDYGLVHYDFEPDNLFYDKETKTCSVIDFNDGMYNWFVTDIE